MNRREQVITFLYRHFGNNFPKGSISFKYGSQVYAVHSLTEHTLCYGPNEFTMTTEGRYSCKNLSVRKSVFGPRAVFDLESWGL